MATVLFLLLFSGPPKFRHRDATASLHGEIDAVILLHIIVWALAGVWVSYQMRFYFHRKDRRLQWRLPQKLGIGLVAALGLSTFVSVAPELTAFKAYQMLVCLLFTMVFVERYGLECCLRKLFQASALLCMAVAVAAFVFPDLVYVTTETGAMRLRGDYLSGNETTSLYCLVMLLAGVQKLSKVTYGLLLCLSCVLLAASLSRTAYIALLVIFLLVIFRRPNSEPFRRFAYIFGFAIVTVFVMGLVSTLGEYRNPEGVWTLSDRVNLWAYLSKVTLQKSPWLGLGYFAGGRLYGLQYDENLGGPHSLFFETFVGGGLLAIAILAILCLVMTAYVTRLCLRYDTSLSFTVTILFLVTLMFGSVGGTLDSGPLAMVFWSLAAVLPMLRYRKVGSARTSMTSKNWVMEPQ